MMCSGDKKDASKTSTAHEIADAIRATQRGERVLIKKLVGFAVIYKIWIPEGSTNGEDQRHPFFLNLLGFVHRSISYASVQKA